MPCLFAIFAAVTPRLALLFYWIARPNMVSAAFNTWIWPLLGLIFLPFTTLFYVLLWTPGIGVTGWDWMWILLAALLDLQHYIAAAAQRHQIPGYGRPSPSTTY